MSLKTHFPQSTYLKTDEIAGHAADAITYGMAHKPSTKPPNP